MPPDPDEPSTSASPGPHSALAQAFDLAAVVGGLLVGYVGVRAGRPELIELGAKIADVGAAVLGVSLGAPVLRASITRKSLVMLVYQLVAARSRGADLYHKFSSGTAPPPRRERRADPNTFLIFNGDFTRATAEVS